MLDVGCSIPRLFSLSLGEQGRGEGELSIPTKISLSAGDLSRRGERNLLKAKARRGPSAARRASHWAGVRVDRQ